MCPHRPALRLAALTLGLSFSGFSLALADVTIRHGPATKYVVSSGLRPDGLGIHIKEGRRRLDGPWLFPGSIIEDLDRDRLVILDPATRTATIYALSAFAVERTGATGALPPTITVGPSSGARQVLGRPCDALRVKGSILLRERGPGWPDTTWQNRRVAQEGTVCVAADGPGVDEYRRFHQRARALRLPPHLLIPTAVWEKMMPQSRVMEEQAQLLGAAASDALAERGIPLAWAITTREYFEQGDRDPLVPPRVFTMEATELSTDAIDDSLFNVPPDYRVIDKTKETPPAR